MKIEKTKILIIDDEEDIRRYLQKTLERSGYEVFIASDGEEGLNKIKELDIEIVFSDILMPKVNGIEFLKKVHSYSLVIQVIMITGGSNLNDCIESVEHGASGYLVKPINTPDLINSILIAERNIAEKKEMIKRGIGQLDPEQVDDCLRRVLKAGKDMGKKKDTIKDAFTDEKAK